MTAALFRPFFFEARNFTQLLNVFETTAILYLVLRMLFRVGWKRMLEKILSHPELTFCIVFTLLTAVAVGMTTPNLGTISRYRVPMMPFYLTAILVLNASTAEDRERRLARARAERARNSAPSGAMPALDVS